MEWKSIMYDKKNIVHKTEKGTLLKLPAPADNYKFWHPSKCIKTDSDGKMAISFSPEFVFKLQKSGLVDGDFAAVGEVKATAEEFAGMIRNPEVAKKYLDQVLEIETREKLKKLGLNNA